MKKIGIAVPPRPQIVAAKKDGPIPGPPPLPEVPNQKFPLSEREQYTSDTMWYAQTLLAAYYEKELGEDYNDILLHRANLNKFNIFDKFGKKVLEPEDDVDTYGMIIYERLVKDLHSSMMSSQLAAEVLDLYVMWICHNSETTCATCRENHLKTFKLRNLPVTHPNCRCGLTLSPNIHCSQEGLAEALEAEFNKDQDLLHKIAHSYNSSEKTVDIILKYDDIITKVAAKYEIDKALIQAILYREIRCYSIQDLAMDPFVHMPKITRSVLGSALGTIIGSTAGSAGSIISSIAGATAAKNPPKSAYDVSVGLGQIKATTAINIMNLFEITKEDGMQYDSKSLQDIIEINDRLFHDDEFNLEIATMILKANSLGLRGTPYRQRPLSDFNKPEEITKMILGRYNGRGDAALSYGEYTYLYYEWFKAYENCGREDYSKEEILDIVPLPPPY